MNAIVRTPDRNLAWDVFNDFDGLLGNIFRPTRERVVTRDQAIVPALDVSESDNQYLVKAELPGVKKDDLDITINDSVLTIRAESSQEHNEEQDGRVIRQERRFGKYVRSLHLGVEIDEENVKAEYTDGILHLTLPKTAPLKPKKIEVSVS